LPWLNLLIIQNYFFTTVEDESDPEIMVLSLMVVFPHFAWE
jgi:hypothetical protein